MDDVAFGVSDFVAVLNQTLEYAFPNLTVVGEIANYKISKNKWVYFDLKDDHASVRFFGTVYQLPGPLEDGMMLQVKGVPRLHPQFGFSVTVLSMQVSGEGSLRRAADLLAAKLTAEGLFDEDRKRALPYPPQRIGLITSGESAAYADFIKILGARWGGLIIELIDVQVQGEAAPAQIVRAIELFNSAAQPPDVVVITRGGGSADDLAAFSTEPVVRAVAASRIPTLVAIGHEIDVSLAELAADRRASTPSNAAEMLTPDRRQVMQSLTEEISRAGEALQRRLAAERHWLASLDLTESAHAALGRAGQRLEANQRLLSALNPLLALQRGYALVRLADKSVARSVHQLQPGDDISLQFADGSSAATIK